MSLIRDSKRETIDAIKEKIAKSKSIVLVKYEGISVNDVTNLRAKFRQVDVEYKVLKNRLVNIALNELGIHDFDNKLDGTTAYAFAYGDAVAAAKVVKDMQPTIKVLDFKCGLVDGKFLNREEVIAFADIPSREVLVAQLLGMLLSPIRGLACAINAIAQQKEN
ncbi:MAG: 50S ribosomal protein L10 [Clostridia bacterium]